RFSASQSCVPETASYATVAYSVLDPLSALLPVTNIRDPSGLTATAFAVSVLFAAPLNRATQVSARVSPAAGEAPTTRLRRETPRRSGRCVRVLAMSAPPLRGCRGWGRTGPRATASPPRGRQPPSGG